MKTAFHHPAHLRGPFSSMMMTWTMPIHYYNVVELTHKGTEKIMYNEIKREGIGRIR